MHASNTSTCDRPVCCFHLRTIEFIRNKRPHTFLRFMFDFRQTLQEEEKGLKKKLSEHSKQNHAWIQKFCKSGPNFDYIFLVDEWREDPSNTIREPSTACQRNAVAFRWHTDDGPILNAGLVALCFFRGSGPALLRNPIFL